jgi:hypothetical protein
MTWKGSDEKTACTLTSKIISKIGWMYEKALNGQVDLMRSSMDEIRQEVDALETVLRRIGERNKKPKTMTKGGAE